MSEKNVVNGPLLQTPSALVYSITLLSGRIVSSPLGFGIEAVDSATPTVDVSEVLEGANTEHLRNLLSWWFS